MKKLFLAVAVATMAAPAFAMHTYRSESCVSTTGSHVLVSESDKVAGGPFALSKRNSQDKVTVYAKAADLVPGASYFEVVREKVLAGESEGACKNNKHTGVESAIEKVTAQKVVNFGYLSPEYEKTVGLKSGTWMIFTCVVTDETPIDCSEVDL